MFACTSCFCTGSVAARGVYTIIFLIFPYPEARNERTQFSPQGAFALGSPLLLLGGNSIHTFFHFYVYNFSYGVEQLETLFRVLMHFPLRHNFFVLFFAGKFRHDEPNYTLQILSKCAKNLANPVNLHFGRPCKFCHRKVVIY